MDVSVWQSVRPFLIDVLTAAAFVLLGSIVGRFLQTITRRAAQALLDRLGGQSAGVGAIGAAAVARTVPVLVGRFVYWLVFIVAAAAAASSS